MTDIPAWLVPAPSQEADKPSTSKSISESKPKPALELLHMTYENMFESILVEISNGRPLKQILNDDVRRVEYEHLLRWIHSDEMRKSRYQEAQELGTEMLASEIIEIADAQDSMEDVARSTLRINARKFVMGAWNRKRYGDIKQVEQSVTVDISAAMEQAEQRIASGVLIEGEYERGE